MERALKKAGVLGQRVSAVDCKASDDDHGVRTIAKQHDEGHEAYAYPRCGVDGLTVSKLGNQEEKDNFFSAKRLWVCDGSADAAYAASAEHDRGPATRVEVSCALSHARAHARALELQEDEDGVLIVEDDVTLGLEGLGRWPVGIPGIVASLPADWEYLQLYTPNPRLLRGPRGLLSENPQLGYDAPHNQRPLAIQRTSTKVFGTQAYLISRRGLARLRPMHAEALAARERDKSQRLLTKVEHWADVRLVADHWVPSLFPASKSYVATVPTFVEDPCVSTIAPGQNSWSHDTARETYLAAFDNPPSHWGRREVSQAPAPAEGRPHATLHQSKSPSRQQQQSRAPSAIAAL